MVIKHKTAKFHLPPQNLAMISSNWSITIAKLVELKKSMLPQTNPIKDEQFFNILSCSLLACNLLTCSL
mgnify:CR=1 FL=1